MRRLSARRGLQALAAAVVAASSSMLLLPGAQAAEAVTTKPAVLQQAWFWQTAYEQANPPVAQQAPATEPSGVPDGDLAVAYTGNSDKSSSKMLALSFDMSSLPSGSSVSAFSFSLTLDSAPGATSFDTQGAAVVACLPTRSWPAQMGGDYTNQPGVDCRQKVTPDVNGNTYTFKIPAIAQTWLDDQNLGVALVADPDASAAPFQLVFAGAKDAHADMTYKPAVAFGSGSSLDTSTSLPAAAPAGAAAPPAALPAGPSTGAAAAPAPIVAPASGPPASARPVAAVHTAPTLPTKGFWAACLAVAALVLLASLVLGDPAPVAATTRSSRLDRVLRERTSF
jgi:hypothetical protein